MLITDFNFRVNYGKSKSAKQLIIIPNHLLHSALEAGPGVESPLAKMSNPSPSGGVIIKTETTVSDHRTLRTILSTSSSTSTSPGGATTPRTPQVSSTISTPPAGGAGEGNK